MAMFLQLQVTLHWADLYDFAPFKVSEVNGSGPTTLSFGAYYGPSQPHGENVHHIAVKLKQGFSLVNINLRNNIYKNKTVTKNSKKREKQSWNVEVYVEVDTD